MVAMEEEESLLEPRWGEILRSGWRRRRRRKTSDSTICLKNYFKPSPEEITFKI
jgi:hypothetical protein